MVLLTSMSAKMLTDEEKYHEISKTVGLCYPKHIFPRKFPLLPRQLHLLFLSFYLVLSHKNQQLYHSNSAAGKNISIFYDMDMESVDSRKEV